MNVVEELFKIMKRIEESARVGWNESADQYNQWDTLGQDEKDDLIIAEGVKI